MALDLRAADGVQACDLLGPREAIRPFFAGADAVVHMAFVPPPSGVSSATTGPGHDSDGGSSAEGANDQLFTAEHLNVQMAYNVFQTASEEGVGRVVMASSNHAADYYEELILDHQYDVVDPDAVARSDNYYGWAKIACEWYRSWFCFHRLEATGSTQWALATESHSLLAESVFSERVAGAGVG